MDERFVGDGGGRVRLLAELAPLGTKVIVPSDDQPTPFAVEGVVDRKRLTTAVAMGWEIKGDQAVPQPQAVTELVWGEFRAERPVGMHGEPCPGLGCSGEPALGRRLEGGEEVLQDSLAVQVTLGNLVSAGFRRRLQVLPDVEGSVLSERLD